MENDAASLKGGDRRNGFGERILVRFPNGEIRSLRNGVAACLISQVIQDFAPRFLEQPCVVYAGEFDNAETATDLWPGLLVEIGLVFPPALTPPALVLFDCAGGDEKLVFVEVVASDGAMTPQRREALARVAASANFRSESVFFVTAFLDRGRPEFRRAAGEIAWDTFAWLVAEPDHLICFHANAQLVLHGLPSR